MRNCLQRTSVWFGLLLAFAVGGFRAEADTHVWAGVGLTGNWSIPANWSANNPPAAGETAPNIIVFPAGVPRTTNTNNIAGLVVDSVFFYATNCTIHGSGVGTNITFRGGNNNFGGYGTNNVFANTLNITLSNSVSFALGTGADIKIQSHLQGSGGISLLGGTLTLNSVFDNAFTGGVSITDGTLYLQGGYLLFSTWVPSIAVGGPVVIGGTNLSYSPTITLLGDSQIPTNSTVTINQNGYLLLNGRSNGVASVTMTGGSLYGGSFTNSAIGTLMLSAGGITASNSPQISSAISANINLGGSTRIFNVQSNATLNITGVIDDGLPSGSRGSAGITKNGTGQLRLFAANTYTGSTTVNAGLLGVYNNSALGTTNIGTSVASGAQLFLGGGISIGSEPLTLNGSGLNGGGALTCLLTNSWGGAVTLAIDCTITTSNATDKLSLFGTVSGSGGISKNGVGILLLAGINGNTFTGNTYVNAGTILLDCGYLTGTLPNLTFVGTTAIPGFIEVAPGAYGAIVRLLGGSQLAASTSIQLDSGGTLDLNNNSTVCGPVIFNQGQVMTGSGTLTLAADLTVLPDATSSLYGNLSLGGSTRVFNLQTNSALFAHATISDGAGSAGITKNGSGSLLLVNSNSYSGLTLVNAGAVGLYFSTSLGTGAGGVTVKSNGILSMATDALVVSNVTLTLDGQGSTNGGRLSSVAAPAYWYGPIVLASDSTFENKFDGDWLVISGSITGPGGVRLVGGDLTYFEGSQDNTYTGTTTVLSNSLVLAKDSGAMAISGPLVIGNSSDQINTSGLLIGAHNQIANNAPITINFSGFINMYSYNDAVGPITFYGGGIFGAGQLTLTGNVTNYGSSYISCPLSLGGQSRWFYSPGYLDLSGTISDGGASSGLFCAGVGGVSLNTSNSFTGPVVLDDELVWIRDPHSLGTAAGGVLVTNGASLAFDSVSVSGETLSIGGFGTQGDSLLYILGTNSWAGPMQVGVDALIDCEFTDSVFTVSGPISGVDDFYISGVGTAKIFGTATNTFTGTLFSYVTHLELGRTNTPAVSGGLHVVWGTTQYRTSNQVADNSPVYVERTGLLNLNNFSDTVGDLMGDGWLTLGSGVLTVGGTNWVDTFSGPISGVNGELDKIGTNTLILSGTNSYTGNTQVKGGTLFINAQQPSSAVIVAAGATLGGTGTVGTLLVNGTVSPGNYGPGQLNAGNTTFYNGSSLLIDLGGPNVGSGFDQLNVTGSITIQPSANLVVAKTFAGAVSNQYTIINNDGSDAPLGTFAGRPNASSFLAGGTSLQINYGSTFGNDVVLTQLGMPAGPQIVSVNKSGGGLQLLGNGVANMIYQIQASTNLATTNWVNLGTVAADNLGAFQFTDAQAGNFGQRFYRLLFP